MIILFKKYIFWIIRNILPLLIFPKKKVIFISVGPSGCNSYALFKYLKTNEKEVPVELFYDDWKRRSLSISEYFKRIII